MKSLKICLALTAVLAVASFLLGYTGAVSLKASDGKSYVEAQQYKSTEILKAEDETGFEFKQIEYDYCSYSAAVSGKYSNGDGEYTVFQETRVTFVYDGNEYWTALIKDENGFKHEIKAHRLIISSIKYEEETVTVYGEVSYFLLDGIEFLRHW